MEQFIFNIQTWTGPALASAGPDWKYFRGTPLSGMCRHFLGGHQVIMIEVSVMKKLGTQDG